ncbi:MvaI/BcnI family restriction endonuclease [Chakrabartyella piscis]|uniref:MvaI/BcnI family restriction endonuclease n=1 Tax=Chakrabartyella piscis TaxID=2918914 RepID=UPI002958B181|nr:MvaI/BcnI family restriction endonuclease [Chakrabartyella piscis]
MLSMSDKNLESVLDIFSSRGLDVSFLVPTITGYKKSIMDAIAPLRNFLEIKGIHNFFEQEQGPEHKVMCPTFLVSSEQKIETHTSLYRPLTKQGDPRIWVNGIKKYCKPNNLLAFVASEGKLYVFNLSDEDVIRSIENKMFVADVLNSLAEEDSKIANELLGKLKIIHQLGFVESVTHGDTGVGMTCESLLGIEPNASKQPDYKGIEIKCSRKKQGQPNRVNLYTQVPDWKNSNGMTAHTLITKYGYWSEDRGSRRFNLYCTVEANRPNPQGLFFRVDVEKDLLINYCRKDGVDEYVAQWSLKLLRDRLLEKHKETFWVKATSKIEDDKEFFRYDSVVHTKKPTASILGHLFDSGIITMDYTMHIKDNGKVRDHGYIFKIKPKHINMLFPEPAEYIL